jgi:predicted Fe-Mo cluster-binding NifX family protein
MPVWEGRISPVLDVAERFLVVDWQDGQETRRRELRLADHNPQLVANGIKEAGIAIVVCGAISQPLELLLENAGIRVIPHICGEVDEVLKAFLSSRLNRPEFAMPGCWGMGRGHGCWWRHRARRSHP